jgi:hypothetical protein
LNKRTSRLQLKYQFLVEAAGSIKGFRRRRNNGHGVICRGEQKRNAKAVCIARIAIGLERMDSSSACTVLHKMLLKLVHIEGKGPVDATLSTRSLMDCKHDDEHWNSLKLGKYIRAPIRSLLHWVILLFA